MFTYFFFIFHLFKWNQIFLPLFFPESTTFSKPQISLISSHAVSKLWRKPHRKLDPNTAKYICLKKPTPNAQVRPSKVHTLQISRLAITKEISFHIFCVYVALCVFMSANYTISQFLLCKKILLLWLDHNFGVQLFCLLTFFSWALETMTANWVPAACVNRGRIWPQPITYLLQEKKRSRTDSLSQGPNPENKLLVEMQWSRKWQAGKMRQLILAATWKKASDIRYLVS